MNLHHAAFRALWRRGATAVLIATLVVVAAAGPRPGDAR